jgi:hypothetical protein
MDVSGCSRARRRIVWRACWSARLVTVQVFTITRSGSAPGAAAFHPRAVSSRAIPAVSHWFTLQPKVMKRKRRFSVFGFRFAVVIFKGCFEKFKVQGSMFKVQSLP